MKVKGLNKGGKEDNDNDLQRVSIEGRKNEGEGT